MWIDNGTGAGTVIAADTERLPPAAAQWLALLDIQLPVQSQTSPAASTDHASQAAFEAMADWPQIQEDRSAQRIAAADNLVAWVGNVSGAFTFTDHSGAGTISNNPANTSPRTIEV